MCFACDYVHVALVTLDVLWLQCFLYSMFVAQMAFYAKISDPLIGGTYMTLLNTVTNLGQCSRTHNTDVMQI